MTKITVPMFISKPEKLPRRTKVPAAGTRKSPALMTPERWEARRAYDRHFTCRGYVLGPAADALYRTGGNELMDWLATNTPEGATILETLAAVALDAMHEEQGT
jgi:hypothetical protein